MTETSSRSAHPLKISVTGEAGRRDVQAREDSVWIEARRGICAHRMRTGATAPLFAQKNFSIVLDTPTREEQAQVEISPSTARFPLLSPKAVSFKTSFLSDVQVDPPKDASGYKPHHSNRLASREQGCGFSKKENYYV